MLIKDLTINKTFDFGKISVSEQEIIAFAEFFDPLDFHTNKETAEKSIFKGLVTSGPHIFNVFYKTKWVPAFKNSVLAGLEMNNWKFLKPIYANMVIACKVTIADIKQNNEKQRAAIKWHFDFTNDNGEFVQTLDMTVLHDVTK
jgi:acyl dehydratase